MHERIAFLQEELDELRAAAAANDLAGQADALVDLVYVAKGTALMLGLPWEELWTVVQRANMAKTRGTTKRGVKADCAKPPGWAPPDLDGALRAAGYERETWVAADGRLNEEACYDQP
jgi:predicted HAD superfamily Cof-like phosphohydrolase